MREVAPGIHHWSRHHAKIDKPVHSYWVPAARAVIDPKVPEEGLGAFDSVDRVLLTSGHHVRDSAAFVERFGCSVHLHETGLHRLDGGIGYRGGDEVAPGIHAREVGALCPDEAALLIDVGPGALAVADGVVDWEGSFGFVPDFLMADEPEDVPRVKRELLDAYARLLDEDWDALLLAHGEPVAPGGHAKLRQFVESAGA